MKKSLGNTFPKLISEWDFDKNGSLSPYDVPPKGRKIVWWKCSNGHSYQAKLAHKSNGKKCPKCHLYNRSITMKTPYILKYWDFDKNQITPDKVTYGSNQIYHWKCERGHKFSSSVWAMTRNKKAGCPYCRGLKVNQSNSLATHYPHLVKEWILCIDDPTLTPHSITPGSSKKVHWKCSKGHEWETTPKHRTTGNTNCPVCNSGNRISKPAFIVYYYMKQAFTDTKLEHRISNTRLSLDIYIPSQQIAIEYDGGIYHKKKKYDIQKDQLLLEKMPSIKLIRIREPKSSLYKSPNKNVIKYELPDQKGKSLQQCLELIFKEIFDVNKKVNIQKDNIKILQAMNLAEKELSLGTAYPNLIKEWDTNKNEGLTPFQFRAASHEKVYWICSKKHSWKATIASRTNGGNNCPECGSRKLNAENNLAAKFPQLINEWNYKKNKKQPQDYFPYSHFSVWWICKACNHEWKSTITNRTSRNSGCPICAKRR